MQFSLYDSVGHGKLYVSSFDVIKNLFDEGYIQCIGIAKFAAFWTDKKDKYMKTFENNFHFTLSKKHFFFYWHSDGFWAILSMAVLFYPFHQEKLLRSTKRRDVQKAGIFAYVFCFIDDLFFLKDKNKSTIIIFNLMCLNSNKKTCIILVHLQSLS